MSERDPISQRYLSTSGVILAPVGHQPSSIPRGWGRWAVLLNGRIIGTLAADPQGHGWWANLKGSGDGATLIRGRSRARDFIVEKAK